jgi:thiamine pyrophosphate-dependent acetolactate synthase large subunit-like protein
MTEIDIISPGYYIEYFRQEDIVDKLDAAVKAMVNLERYVVMTGGGADEKEGYVTLQTLVETTKNKLVHSSSSKVSMQTKPAMGASAQVQLLSCTQLLLMLLFCSLVWLS